MKKVIFVILFFFVLVFGIETFHNDTTKWGDFEAIYCYAQSVWTDKPVAETCAGTMNAEYTIPNGLPYSALMILLFKLFNLMPYWLAAYIWVLAKAFCLVYIMWTISKLFQDTLKDNIGLILLAFLSFGGFYLSNTGQSVTFIVALFVAGLDAFLKGRYKTFAVFIILSASWKYYPAWVLVLLIVNDNKYYKLFFASVAIFALYIIGQALIYPAGTEMLVKFGGFYNNHYLIRYAVITLLIFSFYISCDEHPRKDLMTWIFIPTITFMTIGHKNEYNLIWLIIPLVLLISAHRDFNLWLILAYMITQHAGFRIPENYKIYFVAWAVVAYVAVFPYFRYIKRKDISTSHEVNIGVTFNKRASKKDINKIANKIMVRMNKKTGGKK